MQVHLNSGDTHSAAVPPVRHQSTAEAQQRTAEDRSSSAKSQILPSLKNNIQNLSTHVASKPSRSLPSVALATEMVVVGEFNLGTWCAGGALNLEESPSQESDALRDAYRSLGLGGEEFGALQNQRDCLEEALRHHQEQLQRLTQENAQLKVQLRKHAEEREAEAEQGSSREKVFTAIAVFENDTENNVLAF